MAGSIDAYVRRGAAHFYLVLSIAMLAVTTHCVASLTLGDIDLVRILGAIFATASATRIIRWWRFFRTRTAKQHHQRQRQRDQK